MELKEGQIYKARNGEVRGPVFVDRKYSDRFTDDMGNWYSDDGHYWGQQPGGRFDLIEVL